MTLGQARASTGGELAKYRAPGKKSRFYCTIYKPSTVYTARVNQTFTTRDGLMTVIYDAGSGTLSDVRADMLMYIGSTAGARDVGMVRVRGIDGTQIYFDQTSEVNWQDNQYLTIVPDYRLLARHVNVVSNVPYMDGTVAYSDQHTNFDPTPIMGGHRVLKLTGADVSVTFDWSHSYVIDGSGITGYTTIAPGSSSSSGMSSTSPTIHWNAPGSYLVFLYLTAANGKTFYGVRTVHVYDNDHLPARAKVASIRSGVDTGGPQYEVTLFRGADVSTVYEGALAILFSVDLYGNTESAIGPVPGSENIEAMGWIGSNESIQWNPQRGSVKFTVYGPHYWMQKVPAYPDGVEFVTSTPVAWTQMKNLTLDKGLWHFLHWRCTATRIFDCFLSGNTLYSDEVSSPATNLWSQIQEMAALSIYARPGFNAQGQLFVQVHPQLTPNASRTWPTVLTIQKSDWIGEIDFDRTSMTPLAQLNMSGVYINSAKQATPYFAYAPGHTYAHYGQPELQDKLLIESQAQVISLAGLYYSWRNNPYSEIPVLLKFNTRLIDCFPVQKCAITISPSDTPRGISYSGGIIPKSYTVNFDDDTGRATKEVIFEAETFEGLAVKGDVPGSGDFTFPPVPKIPPLPTPPILLPGGPPIGSAGGPKQLAVILRNYGIALCEAFDVASPFFRLINDGLLGLEVNADRLFKTPSRALFSAYTTANDAAAYVARADYAGAPWTILEQVSKYGGGRMKVNFIGQNPLLAEDVCYHLDIGLTPTGGVRFYHGNGATWTRVPTLEFFDDTDSLVSFGNGKWMTFGSLSGLKRYTWLPDYTGFLATGQTWGYPTHIRIGTTADYYTGDLSFSNPLYAGRNFGATHDTLAGIDVGGTFLVPFCNKVDADPTGTMILANGGVGTNVTPAYSPDGGLNFILIPHLPLSHWRFRYAGEGDDGPSWVCGSSYLYYLPNVTALPVDKLGNLPDLAPSGVDIVDICVLEY